MKPIRLSGHATEQLHRRGVTMDEVVAAIQGAEWVPVERGRLECRMDFPFDAEWNKKHYQTKQVRPIFVDEAEAIVIITVYSFYF